MLAERRNALKKRLEDNDPKVREAAAVALDQVEALLDLPQLLSQLNGTDRRGRISAVYALARVHSSKVFPPLLEALKSEDPDLRAAVAQVLGEKHHPKTLPHLVNALADQEPGVSAEITKALGHFYDPRLPKVLASLFDRGEQVVLAAIDSLGAIGLPEAEVPLIKALDDQRPRVRCRAAQALGKLQAGG